MTTVVSDLRPIETLAGVNSLLDTTSMSTAHYIFADKIRFVGGKPQKIGGWQSLSFTLGNTINGVARSIFSSTLSGRIVTMIGTHTRLYALNGSTLTNVTPLVTVAIPAPNSLDTMYDTLANDPFTTVNGSQTVTIADAEASRLRVSDNVTISGVSGAVNGIPDTDLNGTFKVRSVSSGSYTIIVSTAATSSGSGGGASVIRATGLIRLTDTAHGLTEGDRVGIADAATVGGVTDTQINLEFIIRNVDTDYFDFMTTGTASSSVSAGGGASTEYFPEIPDGDQNEVFGQGYGSGLYGVGLYGTALESVSDRNLVTIWYMDKFGELIIATPGNQSGVYQWNGGIIAAPELVPNAPTAVNYAFISDNILVTFGAGGVENKIFASDQNNIQQWTASSTNQVFEDDIEGAGRFLSHVAVPANNLIFTEQSCYTFRKIPRDSGVWEIKIKDPNIGIIAPMARVTVNGIAYWMGQENFYMWKGGNVEIIPSNNPEIRESTILRYVFDNINLSQKSKIYCWHNPKFNEVCWHYPSVSSNEPDRVVRLSLRDFSWTMDTINRTAAEYPNILQKFPKLITEGGTLYQHENGNDDDTNPLTFTVTSNDKILGKKMNSITGFVPDSIQSGNVTFSIASRRWPQSASVQYNTPYTVTPTTENTAMAISGRIWQYTWSGSDLGQSWEMGQWFEQVQMAGDK